MHLPTLEVVPSPELNTWIFEGQDLVSASPAAVSRCGVVYFCNPDQAWWYIASYSPVSSHVMSFCQYNAGDADSSLAGFFLSDRRQFAEMTVDSWDARILNQRVQLNENAFASGRDVLETLMEHVMKPTLLFISAGKGVRESRRVTLEDGESLI